ncbi:LysR family transcriptional regulator [Xylophilus sp. Kf1]|nr:LysR family transcriptional regulator [Xylophilus sp. Kf1]
MPALPATPGKAARYPTVAKQHAARVLQEQAVRFFLEVVRTGSVTSAAERLNVAPSAVSRQIARLEGDLGTPLFERRARGMVPNAAGDLLAVHAQRALQDIERVAEDIQALRGLRSGLVRVVSTEGFAADFLPTQMVAFRRTCTDIRFELEVRPQGEIARMVREGETDIGVTLVTAPERGIQVEIRRPSPVLAIVGRGHALAGHRQLSLAQLLAWPIALPGPDSLLRQLFDASCGRQSLVAEPAFLGRTMESMIAFVAAGGGVTICGEAALRSRLRSGDLVAIPLRDREMNERFLEVQTLAGRTLSQASRAFLDHLRLALQAEPG